MRVCVRAFSHACIHAKGVLNMTKRGLYFKYLRNEQNEEIDYKYSAPIYGDSNTDLSFFEPNSTRIANMYRSAGSLSKGVYDFDDGKKRDIEDCVVPIGRKPGMTFEEISQIQTYNNQRIKNEAKQIENDELDAQEKMKKNLKEAVAMADAIRNSDSISE